jgi:S-adenosyl-L-methionine hydrolase (adenosine-forming)
MPPPPIITLLTDFGHLDPYVGIMKGVILGICPHARLVDLTHEVAPYQIAQAAFHLQQSWPYFPERSIHLVVIDPGVGTLRRPILVEAANRFFIGPDNGVFSLLDPTEVREISTHNPASTTFHGRDIFAPAAARLAAGAAPRDLGPLVATPTRPNRNTVATVLHIDRFGNIITSLRPAPNMQIQAGPHTITRHATTYADAPPGEPVLIQGSSGYLEIALNQSSAASLLGLQVGDPLQATYPSNS